MKNPSATQIAIRFWHLVRDQQWEEARKVLSDDFEAHWPQSDETFKNPDHFIAMNAAYPGTHKIEVLDSRYELDKWEHIEHVITDTLIETVAPDAKETRCFAISFFEIQGDKITRLKEYWADSYPAPEWRKKWTHPAEIK